MAVTGLFYPKFIDHLAQKRMDLDSDTFKAMLVTSAYTYSSAHDFQNDITNEVTGTGYTAGGATLTSVTWTQTDANSWATSRANSTAYTLGQVVRPATGNGYLYQVVVAGTSGGSIPTYPTVIGQTVTDGGVTWSCFAQSIYAFDCADLSWPASTITAARKVIVYDATPGTSATNPLVGYVDFGTDQSSSTSALNVPIDPLGLFFFAV
jgi:hypothetical protein